MKREFKFEMKFIVDGESKTIELVGKTLTDCMNEIRKDYPTATGFKVVKQEEVL